MPTPTLYYGEFNGPRIIALTDDLTQVTADSTEDVLLAVYYHDLWLEGSAGDFILRELTPVVRITNGGVFDITYYLDEVPQGTQRITLQGSGTIPTKVYPSNADQVRGSRLSVLIEQVAPRTGDFEVVDVGYGVLELRKSP